MCSSCDRSSLSVSRRGFLQTAAVAAAGAPLAHAVAAAAPPVALRDKPEAVVQCVFLYPSTASLEEAGYYSWPGSGFDAEGRQQDYTRRLDALGRQLGMRIAVEANPVSSDEQAAAIIARVKQAPPDGLLIIPFAKAQWGNASRIAQESGCPSVVFAPLGVALVDHINQLRTKPGVYLVNSLEESGLESGLRAIRARRRMRDALLLNIVGKEAPETTVPFWGTTIRTIPHRRFYDVFKNTALDESVRKLAQDYRRHAKEIVEPTGDDILEAARAYYALRRLVEEEKADALMMDCLPGLKRPHQHVPPCMGFMTLRDEGIPAGCQADLNPTLTLMLVQELFDLPGFQQNASMDTERNLYFGAHCTSPSRMNGPNSAAEPYILRSHAEAGWGCVPRVLFKEGQPVTMALYKPGEKPQMLVYTGSIVDCPKIPPAGGCRTNVTVAFDDMKDACDVKGMHQIIFYGNHGRALRAFCQLHGIEAIA